MNVKALLGRPDFSPGSFLGYILWKQSDGFHLRWNLKGKKRQSFQGKIVCNDKVKVTRVQRKENTYKINETKKNTIEWNTELDNGVDGFDFLTPNDFEIELRIKGKKVKTKTIYLGSGMEPAESNPFKVLQPVSEVLLGEESKNEGIEDKKELTTETIKEPEPRYEPKSEIKVERMEKFNIEPKEKEEVAFEPAPLPTPAPEYEIQNELTLTEKSKEVFEESNMMKAPSELNSQAMMESSELDLKKSEPESETRIYEWLTQLVTYRDFTPKEKSVISSYDSLPVDKPEKIRDITPEIEPQEDLTAASEEIETLKPTTSTEITNSKVIDENKLRVYNWLMQLKTYRKFNAV